MTSQPEPTRADAIRADAGPTINAELSDGPLDGKSLAAEVIEGRPPKVLDVPATDGTTYRYCLAGWEQAGASATYTFLYQV